MPPVKHFSVIGTILVAAGLVTAPPAGAQTKEQKAGARAAADAGGDAFDAGKYTEAADLFERAERLMHAPPHLLFAARSHVKLGHLVEARELYLALTRERLPDNAPRAFRDAQQQGEKELADVEPRVAYVSVVVQGGGGATSVHVTRNGEAVPAELLGIPTPINPGDYSYQALADGMESTATAIKLREGVRETVVLTLRDVPGAAKKPPATSADPTSTAPAGSLTSPPPSDSAPSSGGGRPFLIGSIAGFGVAVAGGVVGTIFILKSSDTAKQGDELFNQCRPVGCSLDEQARIGSFDSDAGSQKGVAIAGFITGGVGLAAGVTLLFLDQNRPGAQSEASVTPVLGLGYAGLSGRF
jgi:hypothetical protein